MTCDLQGAISYMMTLGVFVFFLFDLPLNSRKTTEMARFSHKAWLTGHDLREPGMRLRR